MSDSNAVLTLLADVSLPFSAPAVAGLDDAALLELQRGLAEVTRRVSTAAAAVAGEIAHRSRTELAYVGLAQRLGARTPAQLVQNLTGGTFREASALVRVGALLPNPAMDASAPSPADTDSEAARAAIASAQAWLQPVSAAVAAARLSIAAADAIRAGLGVPGGCVTAEALHAAAARLVDEAAQLTVDRLAARARNARAELEASGGDAGDDAGGAAGDVAGHAAHERALRERRYLQLTRLDDGMTRISGLLDPESAALVSSAVDSVTSPRRGGPRFVDPSARALADELARDERTTTQIALDALVEFVRVGAAARPELVLAGAGAAVRILVTQRDLHARRCTGQIGPATIEGQHDSVSVLTAERHLCESGGVPILFDDGGQPLELGRTQRLHSRRQRVAIAARDGGCRFPRCERPPSWCEVHHIVPWSEGGATSVRDGVLLCRHHHLLVHNNGWRIRRGGNFGYQAIPPASLDTARRPIDMPSSSEALARLLGELPTQPPTGLPSSLPA